MNDTNTTNECNSIRREHIRQIYVSDFYKRLWFDAITDEGLNDIYLDWLMRWLDIYRLTENEIIECLSFAGKPEDFLKTYSARVYKEMRSFVSILDLGNLNKRDDHRGN